MQGYRSIGFWAAFLLSVLTLPDVQQLISNYPKSFSTALAILGVLLRTLTTTPIGQKPQPGDPK